MIGAVPPTNPPPPTFHIRPARAPIVRLPRQLDLLGAPPERETSPLTPIGETGSRVNLTA